MPQETAGGTAANAERDPGQTLPDGCGTLGSPPPSPTRERHAVQSSSWSKHGRESFPQHRFLFFGFFLVFFGLVFSALLFYINQHHHNLPAAERAGGGGVGLRRWGARQRRRWAGGRNTGETDGTTPSLPAAHPKLNSKTSGDQLPAIAVALPSWKKQKQAHLSAAAAADPREVGLRPVTPRDRGLPSIGPRDLAGSRAGRRNLASRTAGSPMGQFARGQVRET